MNAYGLVYLSMMRGLGHKRINSNTLKMECAIPYGVSQKKTFVVTVVRTSNTTKSSSFLCLITYQAVKT